MLLIYHAMLHNSINEINIPIVLRMLFTVLGKKAVNHFKLSLSVIKRSINTEMYMDMFFC